MTHPTTERAAELKVGRYIGDSIEALAIWDTDTQVGEIGHPVCVVSPLHKVNELDEDNARRLVASWNALRSLPIAALEAGAVEKLVGAARDCELSMYGESQTRSMSLAYDALCAALLPFSATETGVGNV